MTQCCIFPSADVYGSIEALLGIFSKFDSHLCELRVVHHEVGPVNEADINLAESLNGKSLADDYSLPNRLQLIHHFCFQSFVFYLM